MKTVRTIRGGVINPSFIVVIYTNEMNELWFFTDSEKDLAISYYWRFRKTMTNVKLLERGWQEVNLNNE